MRPSPADGVPTGSETGPEEVPAGSKGGPERSETGPGKVHCGAAGLEAAAMVQEGSRREGRGIEHGIKVRVMLGSVK